MKYILLFVFTTLCLSNMTAQELTKEQKENLKYKVSVFTTNDAELQRLWYEDRMDEMKLRGKLRRDYLKIVEYHALKMEQLNRKKSVFDNAQMRSELEKRIALMNTDVSDMLNKTQLEIHKNSWEAILRGVILSKGLNTN